MIYESFPGMQKQSFVFVALLKTDFGKYSIGIKQ